MKTILLLLFPALAWSYPGPQISGSQINPQSGINISTLNVTGAQGLSVTGPASAGSATVSGAADLGSATVRNSETIVSTLTVQGGSGATYGLTTSTGVSVGSTLSVAGTVMAKNSGVGVASVVASSRVVIMAGGVQWPDGTVSTTAVTQAGSGVTGSGTSGTMTRWTGTSSVGNATPTDDGTTVTIPTGKSLAIASGASTFGFSSMTCVNLTGVASVGADDLRTGISGSTFTLSGSSFTVNWVANICDATGPCTAQQGMAISFLVDGKFYGSMTTAIACASGQGGGGAANNPANLACVLPITVANGTHQFTATWDNTNGGGSNQATCNTGKGICMFCVRRDG